MTKSETQNLKKFGKYPGIVITYIQDWDDQTDCFLLSPLLLEERNVAFSEQNCWNRTQNL